MKKVLCVLLGALILLSGCFSINNLDRLNSEECAEINEKAEGQASTLTMKGGEVYKKVGHFYMGLDSSYWMIDADNQKWASVPTSMIKKISITNHALGLSGGAILGVLGLAAGGSIVIAASDKGNLEGFEKFILETGYICLGVGILSPIVGGIVGVNYTYIFPDTNGIDLDTTSIDIKQSEKNIKVEVSSWEVNGQYLNIIWQGKKIRLLMEEVIQRSKKEDKLYITIPKAIYDTKFKLE